jgi:hypothetical protein
MFFYIPQRPDRLRCQMSLLSNGKGRDLSPTREQSGRRIKLTTHFHIVPRSRIPESSLGNESDSNNGGTFGSGVFYVVRAVFYAVRSKVIYRDLIRAFSSVESLQSAVRV